MTCLTGFRCVVCTRQMAAPASSGTCSHCDDPSAMLEAVFDMDAVARLMTPAVLATRPANHWRYRELLPIEIDEEIESWPVGWTPIIEAPRLAAWVGVGRLRIKDDSRNLTNSFKDRASSLGVAHALLSGAERIACASTGNAASSCAGYAALAGMPATIFLPQRAPQPKVTQLLMYGADVRRVRGSYLQAYELCSRECAEHGWYNRNCAINPYLVEGKKTCGLEIAEQTAGDEPEWVAVSVGDGCTATGIGRGLMDMKTLGYLDYVPAVLGVQSAGVAPIAGAFESGEPPVTPRGTTIADSIDVPAPRNWRKAVHEVRRTGGAFARVTDDAIVQAMRACGSLAGVFAEPAAAAAVAGVRQAVANELIEPESDVLVVITGSGLKDIQTAMEHAGSPVEVDVPKELQ